MSRLRPYRSKAWLEHQIKQGLSYSYIADYCGISRMTLYRWRKKLGVKVEEESVLKPEIGCW